jgi:hypothetical protein
MMHEPPPRGLPKNPPELQQINSHSLDDACPHK